VPFPRSGTGTGAGERRHFNPRRPSLVAVGVLRCAFALIGYARPSCHAAQRPLLEIASARDNTGWAFRDLQALCLSYSR
jgi:hypothetical protein